ncbi:HTH_48 domain-containing protein [Trichonephila inaurata madagascariensis]|uniref:HTH_48 domain-containing protein n=1 Tax=Trichonephila inaurata madagascariensis TaxID=2747483 RepID=A0A8X7BSV2_9ARAC|nr:HTH_48 domain-containing protein [Trichonephila inaurata madagascariensis]
MLHHFENGWKAAQSFRDLNELFGKGTISESQCRDWFARFKSGDTSLEDKPGRGRPSDFDDQALLASVEEDENLTTRMLAEDSNVSQSTVDRRLKKLRSVKNRWMGSPRALVQKQIVRIFCCETNKHHF